MSETFCLFPESCHKLGAKCLNTWICGVHFRLHWYKWLCRLVQHTSERLLGQEACCTSEIPLGIYGKTEHRKSQETLIDWSTLLATYMDLLGSITFWIILEISRSKCSPYPYPWHKMTRLCLRSARKLRNPNLECPPILWMRKTSPVERCNSPMFI